jgi:hypothetical protein
MRVNSANIKIIGARGFTLVEIFIVGVLIALFASIAIINIQTQFEINKRKAAIADINRLATSTTFCYNDIAIFPKFCFLDKALDQVAPLVGGIRQLSPDFDYMGHPITALQSNIINNWDGPYAAASASRRKIARQGGIVDMILPYSGETVDWPSDPWGNPYVLYQVYIYNDESGNPVFDWIPDATTEPNYFLGAVSYGRNSVPGAKVDVFDQIPEAFKGIAERERLYVTLDKRIFLYRALTETEYNAERLAVLSRTAPDAEWRMVGIVDAGSDDIIFEF